MSLSLLPVRTSSSPPSVACRASKKADGATGNAKKKGGDYQEAWFKSTRATLDAQSTTEGRRRVIREYVEANRKANGGREREDLYTDNWDGAFRRSSVVGCRLSCLNSSRDVRRPLPLPLSHTHTLCASLVRYPGDVYKGNPVNVLSVILGVSILAPLIGLIFALQTYGTLWG